MLIGYLDMDVPLGTPVFDAGDFQPATDQGHHCDDPGHAALRGRRIVPSPIQRNRGRIETWAVSSNRFATGVLLSVSIVCGSIGFVALVPSRGDESGLRDIPPAFTPFEYLVGHWKGQARPKGKSAQQFRGWTETHAWAWIFKKGKPTGLIGHDRRWKVPLRWKAQLRRGTKTVSPRRD